MAGKDLPGIDLRRTHVSTKAESSATPVPGLLTREVVADEETRDPNIGEPLHPPRHEDAVPSPRTSLTPDV
jgi:hypothetical protein